MRGLLRVVLPALALTVLGLVGSAPGADEPKPIRVGIIGLDTSHVVAFTQTFNAPKTKHPELAGIKVVAAFPGGSPDVEASSSRVDGFTKTLKEKYGVEMVDSVEALLPKVDAVLLESVDGRPHLKQAEPVLKAHKPVFIDKPLAGTLADALEIARLAEKYGTPCFSASSLRYHPALQAALVDPKLGKVVGCDAFSPCSLEPHHPDLFWYGVHGVESLFTAMGPGCVSVTRAHTEGTDQVTGIWKGGRVGTFRGIREGKSDYGVTIIGTKSVAHVTGAGGYEPLLVQIGKFFRTGKPPVSLAETVEQFAFMEAADESKRQGGKPVTIESVISKARETSASASR